MNLPEFYVQLIQDVQNKFGQSLLDVIEYQCDVTLHISLPVIHEVLEYLKTEHRFIYLVDIAATDRFTSDDRFELIYNIVSLKTQKRILVKTRCSEESPEVPTVVDIWPAANWLEREAYDMFGIFFKGHPDLRRLFLPEDFKYYPLRKEFPLMGIPGSLELPRTIPDVKA